MLRLEHANLAVSDADATTAFLVAAFPDFRLRGSGVGLAGLPWRHVGNDDFYLALTTVDNVGARQPYSNSLGLNHLGWEVDSVAAVEERMKQAGFTPNLRDNSHPARQRLYFYDPDGNDWEFVQYNTDDKAERNDYSDAA